MKVWLVRTPDDPYLPWDVDGVFSSLEKAIEYSKTLRETEYEIEEWEIDKPDSGKNVEEGAIV